MPKGYPKNGVNKGWFLKGVKFTEEFKQKIRAGVKKAHESEHWKGDDIKYYGLHDWVYTTLGQPDICVHCGRTGLKHHQIHWANRSNEYKRDVNDWLRMCVKCHSNFDKFKRLKNEYEKYLL